MQVGVTMHIIGISQVSEVQMVISYNILTKYCWGLNLHFYQDFTSDFYFRQTWNDTRLQFKPLPGIANLVVGAEVANKIWLPDTFFANEKSAYFHMATTPNTFLRIGSNGNVYRSIR